MECWHDVIQCRSRYYDNREAYNYMFCLHGLSFYLEDDEDELDDDELDDAEPNVEPEPDEGIVGLPQVPHV